MNYMRQQIDDRGRAKKFHLSLKKRETKTVESSKENNANCLNRNSPKYDNYRSSNISEDEEKSPIPNSQNYILRLSDDDSSSSDKNLPYNYRRIGRESRRERIDDIERNESLTVSIDDSNNSSTGDNNSPHSSNARKKNFSRNIRPTPFYRPDNNPAAIIIIESSDTEEEQLVQSDKDIGGMICSLLSDDDSVLNAIKNDDEVEKKRKQKEGGGDAFDRLRRSINYSRSLGSLSSDSPLNSSRDKKKLIGNERSGNPSGGIKTLSISGADNLSDGSSSTNFSPDSNVIGISRDLNKQKIISESSSSSNDDETESLSINARRAYAKNLGDRNNGSNSSSYNKWKRKSSSSNDSIDKKINSFANVTSRSNSGRQNSTKPYDSSVKLTKKDAEGIFKGVKIGGGINSYWTPKLSLPICQDSESLASFSPAVLKGKGKNIVNETASELLLSESNSENEIISNSSEDFRIKPRKTHVSRFINPPNQEEQHSSLSDRKKNEISHWIMNNTPGSSSSSSIISESNRNSSFGNSSLERFELKHETPNNRGKISKPSTLEKASSVPKGIERYIYKGKTSVLKNQTPLGVGDSTDKVKPLINNATPINTKKVEPKQRLPIVKTVENLHIEDCADILDKLYGNGWRDKADAVLTPKTEPRNKINSINKEQLITKSNTERKVNNKYEKDDNIEIISSSEEDDSDVFAKDFRPIFNSTKKKLSRDSFIDDKSPSENSSESFYHTALTNPRESRDNRGKQKPVPVSLSTKRAVAICDSDSDVEDDYPRQILNKDLNKKRLSFSEDASNSSTSEFDPGEVVPPKPKAKKVPAKSLRQTPKSIKPQGLNNFEHNSFDVRKSKSFLASLSATIPIENCHPDAKDYRVNYKNRKEELCKYLFQLYNKEIFDGKLPADMAIEWNVRMRGTAGFCYNKKSVKALGGIVRSSRIVLATKILDTPDRLRDTLVHEMCHAAAWLINNVSDGHGPYWKGWASKAIKVFPELPPIKRCHDYKIKTKFTYRCTKCGYSIGRHSKSLNIETKRCGHCYGKFELLVNRTTRSGTTQVSTPAQSRTPTGFALYVKENYHSVKKDRRSLKHAEVMRILGQQFSAVKIGKKQHTEML